MRSTFLQIQVTTSILGGTSTVIASYLARVRNSNEPETSNGRVRDLSEFLRECYAFVEDYGYDTGGEYNGGVVELGQRFEELLKGADSNVGGGGGISAAGTGAGAGAGNGNGNGNGGGGNMSEGNGSGYNRGVCLHIWTLAVYFLSYVGTEPEPFFRFFGSLSSLRV